MDERESRPPYELSIAPGPFIALLVREGCLVDQIRQLIRQVRPVNFGHPLIDLGLGHSNYDVTITLQGGLAAQNIAPALSVTKLTGTSAGKFTITAGKFTAAADTTIIAATAACTVSFTVIAGASVE